ncbi:hypothetical protein J7643_13920 [bacterium]|nr:hypothetical protein [bacterium]
MPSRVRRTIGLGLAVLALAGCFVAEEDDALIPVQALPDGGGQADPSLKGALSPGTVQATNSATPAPTPTPPDTPSPTPKPTAAPLVAIRAVQVSRTHLVLFLPPRDPALGLGLVTQHQLTGSATRADGFPASIQWVDRSSGQLALSPTGLVSTKPTTVAGDYRVRCAALDDPHVFQDVTIEVRATSALTVIVQ